MNSERTSEQMAELTRSSFNRLIENLGITAEEKNSILGASPVENLRNLKKTPDEVREDQLERMTLFLEICFLTTGTVVRGDRNAKFWCWLIKPNDAPIFKSTSPLNLLLKGDVENLRTTAQYLSESVGAK